MSERSTFQRLTAEFTGTFLLVFAGCGTAGGVGGAALLYVIAAGRPGFHAAGSGFAINGYAARSPGGYTLGAAFLTETVMTMIFLAVILTVTGRDTSPGVAAAVIGCTLLVIHLLSIPVTNTSVNPARSLGPAVFVDGGALAQLWLFFAAPLLGAALIGAGYPLLLTRRKPGPRAGRRAPEADPATPVTTVSGSNPYWR